MKNLLVISMLLYVAFEAGLSWRGVLIVHAQGGGIPKGVPKGNGDVNGDGQIDITDAIYMLTSLFLGGEAPVPIECPPPVLLAAARPIGNGDVNGDRSIDISDAVYILANLFAGGPEPEPLYCQRSWTAAPLPDTGQTKCYGDPEGQWIEQPCESTICTGQDGAYLTGCSPEGRFSDNGDGTVTDYCTGLMWQKEAAPESTHWQAALKYCDDLELSGYRDWRLPNVIELQSIGTFGGAGSWLDPVFGVPPTNPGWSSTSVTEGPSAAWLVELGIGPCCGKDDIGTGGSIRAVRGEGTLPATGQAQCYDAEGAEIDCANADFPGQDGLHQAGCPREGRFIDNGDGTVTDTCTGLMWQKETADVNGDSEIEGSDTLLWCGASSYCEDLGFAGYNDWRLPNVRELQSIVHYGRANPAIDPVFSSLWSSYWSSTVSSNGADYAWNVNFATGIVSSVAFEPASRYVRPVRNAQ